MPSSTPKTLACPTCGAPLDYDGSSAVVRCKFCQNVVVLDALKSRPKEKINPQERARIPDDIVQLVRAENKLEAIKRYREHFDVSSARAKHAIEQIEAGNLLDPDAGFKVQQAETAIKAGAATAVAVTATGTWLGCVIPAIILLFVGSIVGFVLLQPGGPFLPRLIAMDEAIPLQTAQGIAPDVIAVFYNPNDENRMIARINQSDSKPAWKTEALPGDGYVDEMVTDGERVYAAVEAELLAFNAADGSLSWKISLPDKLDSGDNNLMVKNGMVIVMTMDRSIHGYEAGTGKEIWGRELLSYARGLRSMGKWLVILDYIKDGYDLNVFLLDPTDGSEDRVIFPACTANGSWEENLDDNSGIVYDEATNALYLVFGTSLGCIQRHDLGSGQLTWEIRSEDSFDTGFYGFNHLQSAEKLYFGNQTHLFSVDKQNGELKLLFEDEAYEIAPLAVSDKTMLVLARRTKGSQRFELWGLDSDSGERMWQMIPENATPVDPPFEMSGLIDEGEAGWTWQMTSTGFLLIKFQAEPNQIELTTYDPARGVSLGDKIVPLKDVVGDFYSVPTIIGWDEDKVYFILDGKVYALDVTSGQLVMSYQ